MKIEIFGIEGEYFIRIYSDIGVLIFDYEISDFLQMTLKDYQNNMVNQFNAYLPAFEVAFKSLEDINKAINWIEGIIIMLRLVNK